MDPTLSVGETGRHQPNSSRTRVPFGQCASIEYHDSHTYSFGGLCTDGEAGPQKAPQGCRELELGCSPSVKASPEQDSKVTHLRKDPDLMNTQPPVYLAPGPVSKETVPLL